MSYTYSALNPFRHQDASIYQRVGTYRSGVGAEVDGASAMTRPLLMPRAGAYSLFGIRLGCSSMQGFVLSTRYDVRATWYVYNDIENPQNQSFS